MRKFVAFAAAWAAREVAGGGDDIAISGSVSIVRQLLDAGLIDELNASDRFDAAIDHTEALR